MRHEAATLTTPLIVVVGATGTGKSDLALELASRLGGEIVNADASQLYRGMDIGTAKLPPAERRGIVHHQLDVLDVRQTASVAAYQRAARAAVDDIASRGLVPVLVGGSGLYVKAVLDPLEFPGTDADVRAGVQERAERIGPRALHAQLAELDPVAAQAIHPANVRRVVRALEVIQLTGRPFSATLPRDGYLRPTVQLGLRRPRPELDDVLAVRVHRMLANGFVEEVRALLPLGLREGRTARTALGYAQLVRHLDGELTLDEAVEQTIAATRAFAKRQGTWFGRDQRISWLPAGANPFALADEAMQVISADPVGAR